MHTTGIKRLDMLAPGTDGRKAWESVGITSPDGGAGLGLYTSPHASEPQHAHLTHNLSM